MPLMFRAENPLDRPSAMAEAARFAAFAGLKQQARRTRRPAHAATAQGG